MTKFNQRRFSVSAPLTDAYARGWERIFGKKEEPIDEPPIEPLPCGCDGVGGPPFQGAYHFRECPLRPKSNRIDELERKKDENFGHLVGDEEDELTALKFMNARLLKAPVSRIELERWLERLTNPSPESIASVRESIKLVLQADRISDPLAMKK